MEDYLKRAKWREGDYTSMIKECVENIEGKEKIKTTEFINMLKDRNLGYSSFGYAYDLQKLYPNKSVEYKTEMVRDMKIGVWAKGDAYFK